MHACLLAVPGALLWGKASTGAPPKLCSHSPTSLPVPETPNSQNGATGTSHKNSAPGGGAHLSRTMYTVTTATHADVAPTMTATSTTTLDTATPLLVVPVTMRTGAASLRARQTNPGYD